MAHKERYKSLRPQSKEIVKLKTTQVVIFADCEVKNKAKAKKKPKKVN